jgi:uncharacterized protein YndB with AHSA1/START domain
MLKTVAIGFALLVALVAGFCIYAAMQPAEFSVERSTSISAPPAVVFAQVNDLHEFQEFSPWAKRDPAAKNTFEGPAAGVGSVFAWEGNAEVGKGRMTIVESVPNERIRIRLDFLEPFAATNTSDFTFTPQGDQTRVVWSLHGHNDFTGKVVGLLMDMDAMIGGDFEKGLADLKSLAETSAGVGG